MKRRLFHAGALVSLVLCLAASTTWLRSYWYGDMLLGPLPLGCSFAIMSSHEGLEL
jgi:hypothetical protein